MEILVNGEAREIPSGATLFDLIVSLGLRPESVVAERNAAIIDKDRYSETPVNAGDVVELVNFVGGG